MAGASVTSRALGVLDAFDTEHPRRTLTDIAAATGLPLTTCHRLIGELVAGEALVRGEDGAYEIGRRIWQLGLLASESRELRDVAVPFMQDIASTTGDNVHLAVRQGLDALYVERIAGSKAVSVVSRPGSRLPLHATGVGKVLLAHAPADVRDAALADLTRVTAYTVVEPGRMQRQLADVRRRGYAQTAEEMTLGTVSIAVPVSDSGGAVVAALGIVGTSSRRDLTRTVPVLQVAALAIGRTLVP